MLKRVSRKMVLAIAMLAIAIPIARRAGAHGSAPSPHPSTSPFPNGLSPQWLNAANVDPVGCLATLQASGAKYKVLAAQERPDRKGCGMPHGVVVVRGPTGITYNPPLEVDCSFAVELGPIENVIQDEARQDLGIPIVRIDTLGAYVCVTKAGPYTTRFSTKPAISEHSFGLAYDLRALTTRNGHTITIEHDYEKGNDDPRTANGRFLFQVAMRLRRETHLTHVLTPDFNADHRNHFHLDRGLRFGWWWNE